MSTPVKGNLAPKFQIAENIPIYRYMSIEQFIAMGESQTLVLPKVTSWEDPNEAYYTRQFYDVLARDFLANDKPEDAKECEKQKVDLFRRTYGLCFSHEKEESDALWRIYSGQKSSIRIATDAGKLEVAVQASTLGVYYSIGKISYEQLAPPRAPLAEGTISDKMDHFFIKTPPFQHESEARIVASKITNPGEQVTWPDYLEIPIGKGFLSQATVDPRSDGWIVKALKSYCRNKSWLKDVQVEKSQLYKKFEDWSS